MTFATPLEKVAETILGANTQSMCQNGKTLIFINKQKSQITDL
jgi:hypothetical protein